MGGVLLEDWGFFWHINKHHKIAHVPHFGCILVELYLCILHVQNYNIISRFEEKEITLSSLIVNKFGLLSDKEKRN